MDAVSLGKKLRTYRARRGWSLNECAEKIGISTRYLNNIESGDKVPKLETFILILNTLTASADDVLQDSLAVGYVAKSSEMTDQLRSLDIPRRRQALDIFSSVIASLKGTESLNR